MRYFINAVLLLPLLSGGLVPGEELKLPPSPSSVPGKRILPPPAFTVWPAVVYADEVRNVAFRISFANPREDAPPEKSDAKPVVYAGPVPMNGWPGRIGWEGQAALPFVLPDEGHAISGLLPLPLRPGSYRAALTVTPDPAGRGHPVHLGIGPISATMALRVCDARLPWPLARLDNGYPVDAVGVPVVLLDQRRNADQERRFAALKSDPPRPTGRALVVGDPMEALGVGLFDGLDADCLPATDERHPQHAVLVALAQAGDRQPRTLVWCPGNQALFSGCWTQEEERMVGIIRSWGESRGFRPHLVLALPPVPLGPTAGQARERREYLRRAARLQRWLVLDLEQVAGPAEEANRVAEGVFTTYPCREAQAKIRMTLQSELAK